MKHLLSLLLILACYYVKGQTIHVDSFDIFIGHLVEADGNYNIIVKDYVILPDTSFVFIVDYDHRYLKDRGDLVSVLRGAEKQMKQQPSLRTNVTYRKALYFRLVMLMQSGYGLIADTLHFSIPTPPGTVGWTKWCDTCQTVFFGFYHDGRITDYIGGFGRSKAAALPMVITPCDLDDKTKWIQPL